MDQKNTIVKCARRNCLWNYRGICDRYVIPISADGQCDTFVETAPNQEEINAEALAKAQELHQFATEILERQGMTLIPPASEPIRGQREKCNLFDDRLVDPEIVKEVCQPFLDVNDELQKIISSCILTPEETGVGLKRLASLVDQSKRAAERCKYLSPEEKEWTACPYMVRGNCTHPSADNITACCYMSTEEVIDEI